jgi:hypothetical protein
MSGTAIGVPENTGGRPISFSNNKTQTNSQNIKHARDNHDPVARARGPGGLSGPPEQSAPGPQAPLGETPSRSRDTAPY